MKGRRRLGPEMSPTRALVEAAHRQHVRELEETTSPAWRARARARAAGTAERTLTPAEQHVLELLARGKTNGQIARLRSTKLETVKAHVRSVLRKLRATSRAHAVTQGFALGLLSTASTDASTSPSRRSSPSSGPGSSA